MGPYVVFCGYWCVVSMDIGVWYIGVFDIYLLAGVLSLNGVAL